MKATLSPEEATAIRDLVEEHDCSIYEQYSGRFMYGAQCFGITISRHASVSAFQLGMLIGNLREDSTGNSIDLAEAYDWKCSEDSLGMDQIIYFPNIQWPEEEDEDIMEDENGDE